MRRYPLQIGWFASYRAELGGRLEPWEALGRERFGAVAAPAASVA